MSIIDSETKYVEFELNGEPFKTADRGETLLDTLRWQAGLKSVKDGCAPQGQCGCCTVLVDGKARVACVTPTRRVASRKVVTLEGLDAATSQRWSEALCSTGGSQCGFCTPGIVMRLDALVDSQTSDTAELHTSNESETEVAIGGTATRAASGELKPDQAKVDQALLAHLCRCTGWQTISEAVERYVDPAWNSNGSDSASCSQSSDDFLVSGLAGGFANSESVVSERGSRESASSETASPESASSEGGSAESAGSGTSSSESVSPDRSESPGGFDDRRRDLKRASLRATIEGRAAQVVSPGVALGYGGFAADTAPPDCLVALRSESGWVVGQTIFEVRELAGKVQGRRTTVQAEYPLAVPAGGWLATLQTFWTDPAYLETDASWCKPGGKPFSHAANGGAFGAKIDSEGFDEKLWQGLPWVINNIENVSAADRNGVSEAARHLADKHQKPVLVLVSREEVTQFGVKRPPVAGAANADGSGVLKVAATEGIVEAVASVAPNIVVEQTQIAGPPTSIAARGAGWVEALMLLARADYNLVVDDAGFVTTPWGAKAKAGFDGETILVDVACGPVLDSTVLRSYCIGAAHMAWSWLTHENLVVDDDGEVQDLTVRSFGVARAVDTPKIVVNIVDEVSLGEPVNGSDAVFAAVAVLFATQI